jgi:23S rRNA (adenine2503-C2)-methyltransferase
LANPGSTEINPKDLAFEDLAAALAPAVAGGEPAAARHAARRVYASLFRAGGAATHDALRRAPQIPRAVRAHLAERAALPSLSVVERRRAADGFVKYLFESPLGGRFEAVRIPIFDEKLIVCVSSQVGCGLGCAFCMTGRLGLRRDLETWEIVDQVLRIRAEAERPVRGVVFMGMGEPLQNYDATIRAARILAHPAGCSIAAKAISFSTVGIVPAIRRYTRERHRYRLVFSLTSAIAEKRGRLLPVERAYPLPELVRAIAEHAASRRERAVLAYVMIRGFNTGTEDAAALASAFAGVPIKLDLIDVSDPTGRYLPPTASELSAFRDALQILHAPIGRRYSGGAEIGAACGTLAATQAGGLVVPEPRAREPR